MAQKRSAKTGNQRGKNRKPAKTHSENRLNLEFFAGVLLLAAGTLSLLAVAAPMKGELFAALRNAFLGLGGSLAFLPCGMLIWSGVMTLLSVQKQRDVQPFWLSLLAMILLLAAVDLLSQTQSAGARIPLMDSWKNQGSGYAYYLNRAWSLHNAGGVIGMALAWPVWRLLGAGFGGLLCAAAAIAALFFALRKPIRAITGRLLSRADRGGGTQKQRRGKQSQQSGKQPTQNLSRAEQQSLPLEGWQQHPAYTAGRDTAPGYGFGPEAGESFVPAPVNQIYTEQIAEGEEQPQKEAKPGWTSRIFGGKAQQNPQNGMAQRPQRPKTVQPVLNPFDEADQPGLPLTQPAADGQGEGVQTSRPKRPRKVKPAETTPAPAGEAQPVTGEAEAEKSLWQRQLEEKLQEQAAAPKPRKPKPSWREDQEEEQTPPWETGEGKLTVTSAQQEKQKEPEKQEKKHRRRAEPEPEPEPEEPEHRKPYVFPDYKLLNAPKEPPEGQEAEDAARARALEETLDSFHIPAKVQHVVHGPAVSRFEVEIAGGIKVDKVVNLERNIIMNLQASDVRILAPIPGKSLVGVEVPNVTVTPVVLREVLESPAMQKVRSSLVVALGKDITGQPVVCDLERMPHLLIAGQTGSGKSVCINSIIMTLLYRTTPEEVRMILIDPKVVELSVYNGVPHLLLPVVNDPHKAAGALQWAVNEMMDRYKRFAERGVRGVTGYNASLGDDEEPMPRIVIIIDELADLMLVCRKDVESHIQRLTQLARAAGIHLVVATQRPSVDVITGVIKSNIPSRIAFKVSSIVDSRTILDYQGAEKLLGKGDMLFNPTGAFTPQRVQGCFMTDEEVQSICDDIRRNNTPAYDASVVEMLESISEGTDMPDLGASDRPGDSMLQQAVEMTVLDGQVSTSMIQRKLRLGYARAGRLVDRMEELGIVSQKDGAKPRLCLITREQYEQMKETGLLEE